MASITGITKVRRKIRRGKLGKKRKAEIRSKGSTPKFPIHKSEAK